MLRHVLVAVSTSLIAAVIVYVLGTPVGVVPALGLLLDPHDGLYRTARNAEHPVEETVTIPGLQGHVEVVRDERGVPHIFAESDRDAIMAFGYVVAQDRLFQMDFIPRVASGRLAEVMGEAALPTDRFLRKTGMELGAQRNLERIRNEASIEQQLLNWYIAGVNAYIDGLADEDLPLEFRLLGYRPERYTPLHVMRLIEYMTYDLSYHSDDAVFSELRSRLGEHAYRQLYPEHAPLYVPIIPSKSNGHNEASRAGTQTGAVRVTSQAQDILALRFRQQRAFAGSVAEGFIEGKGSNNWAVSGARSATGAPILAGDMHLSLSLPSLWYEIHLVTPSMNTYGVTLPGAPLPVEAFNDVLGWTFTNTGSDQIDHYALRLDSTGTRYWYEQEWRDLELVPDTIWVRGQEPVIDTLYYSHFGPVLKQGTSAVAIRWMGHEPSRLLAALWGMNRARSYREFEEAIRSWDSPMQNILYADKHGTIAIRSAGRLPIRKGGAAEGLLDGTTDDFEWVGRIPFEELPHAIDPEQGYLTSTNQEPTDSTYAYYLGYNWGSSYRSLRIDSLLSGKPRHSVDDMKRYQADVYAMQRDLFAPLLDTLQGLSPEAEELRAMLVAWDGNTTVDRPEPTVLYEFLRTLNELAWDEEVFRGSRAPTEMVLYRLLRNQPASLWLDVQSTSERETAGGLLRLALNRTADSLRAHYGTEVSAWRWGDHHKVIFRHLTRSEALRPLWRGPMEYPGFIGTLSPAGELMTTHSASWRVVVDFSEQYPVGYGVYPGGASGNPMSRFYDLQVPAYVNFEYHLLRKPRTPDELQTDLISSRVSFMPQE